MDDFSIEEGFLFSRSAEFFEGSSDGGGEGVSGKSFVGFFEIFFCGFVCVDEEEVESKQQRNEDSEGQRSQTDQDKKHDQPNTKSVTRTRDLEFCGLHDCVDATRADEPKENGLHKDIKDEPKVAFLAHTDSDPRAMMIEFLDAVIADVAMSASWRASNVAIGAVLKIQSEGVHREGRLSPSDDAHL
mgnify:CR=1 FL=1